MKVPVTNLRRKPVDARREALCDELQETQLLFNEILLLRDETKDWCYVEAEEQPKFDQAKGWYGYPGWVRKRHVRDVEEPAAFNGVVCVPFTTIRSVPAETGSPLFPVSLGTKIHVTGEEKGYWEIVFGNRGKAWIRATDVDKRPMGEAMTSSASNREQLARLFLGVPYLWGGRSMPLPSSSPAKGGVDCSGLTNLLFRADHIDIPRDAHDQWITSHPIGVTELREGDLIFVSQGTQAETINHVMVSLTGEAFVEASETGDRVKIRTFAEKFGVDLAQLAQLDFMVGNRRIYFGRIG